MNCSLLDDEEYVNNIAEKIPVWLAEGSKVVIKGITIGKKETKLLQHADDTTAVLSDTNSAQILFRLLDEFKKLSGLAVNPTKTGGMWIGSLRKNKKNPLALNG